jgi:23S rRNA pseudouridine2605 synthase
MNPRTPGVKRPTQPRRNRTGKRTPFRSPDQGPFQNRNAISSPSQVADMMRQGGEVKSGQFAEQLQAGNKQAKRERLHKVLAQSGHGSRRDMEILIASGRVAVNGNIATAGAQVGPGDIVLIDHRPVKISYSPELPRVLLYHKPEGEIVTTSDPGNRITVFDNLPKVENGKWVVIGRLDINTSGLLIFTTSGELANRMMHPRYEVEREYAVRILGELTEEQTQRLLAGLSIDAEVEEDHEDHEDRDDIEGEDDGAAPGPVLARFDSIEPRGGEGANHWYHVVLKEGRNREVRRMFEALGLTVSRLMRVRFGKVELPPRLMRGKMLELNPAQVREVLTWAGVSTEGMEEPRQQQKDGRREGKRENKREGQSRDSKRDGQQRDNKREGQRDNTKREGQRRQGQQQGRVQGAPPPAGAQPAGEGSKGPRRHRLRRTRGSRPPQT